MLSNLTQINIGGQMYYCDDGKWVDSIGEKLSQEKLNLLLKKLCESETDKSDTEEQLDFGKQIINWINERMKAGKSKEQTIQEIEQEIIDIQKNLNELIKGFNKNDNTYEDKLKLIQELINLIEKDSKISGNIIIQWDLIKMNKIDILNFLKNMNDKENLFNLIQKAIENAHKNQINIKEMVELLWMTKIATELANKELSNKDKLTNNC